MKVEINVILKQKNENPGPIFLPPKKPLIKVCTSLHGNKKVPHSCLCMCGAVSSGKQKMFPTTRTWQTASTQSFSKKKSENANGKPRKMVF